MNLPEPYRIKSVESIRLLPRGHREKLLEEAGYNLFQLAAENVFIDLLTDSGTGAMSADQWAALMQGDESYAGSRSYFQLQSVVEDLFHFPHVLPTHQGRGAERVFFQTVVKEGDIIPSNTHFDTTRGNLESLGCTAVDLPVCEAKHTQTDHPFKGDMDIDSLESLLASQGKRVPFVMLTMTNNRAGGQPVSMENLALVSSLARFYRIPLVIDACRHAENAFFIKRRDPRYQTSSIPEIVAEVFSFADAMLMSAKKDGLCNIGGFIALRDSALFERLKNSLLLMEGFPTYGGLAGRDLAAMAVGLREATQEDYLEHRIGQVEFLGTELLNRGGPVYQPFGGHAVYMDAGRIFEEHPRDFPGQCLAVSLYLEGGIRSCDVGSSMFDTSGENELKLELLRLAIPRRTYTESHLRYVADYVQKILERKQDIPDLKRTHHPGALGHFVARYALAPQQESMPAAM